MFEVAVLSLLLCSYCGMKLLAGNYKGVDSQQVLAGVYWRLYCYAFKIIP